MKSGVNIVGRNHDCDIILEDKNKMGKSRETISRSHLKIDWKAGDNKLIVSDLGTTNDSFLNGEKLEIASFQPGDNIHLGDKKNGAELTLILGTPKSSRRRLSLNDRISELLNKNVLSKKTVDF